jgi:L-asparaginase II
VLISAAGEISRPAGRPADPVFPRSANKPIQAAAMTRSGLGLDGELLALAAASHSGEPFHVAGVTAILAGAGLTEADLRCPPDLPLDTAARNELLASGGKPDRLHMNCSGKHAAMLATCVAAGWPTDSYTDPGHPLQRRIAAEVSRLAGEPVAATGIDGCGAPLFALSLTGVARAFRALVLAPPGTAERRVADAMRAFPAWASGTSRPDQVMMASVPGLLVKSGAEAVMAFALADGRAGAVKIEDGAQRAVVPVVADMLLKLAADTMAASGRTALERLARPAVYGGGAPVGHIRATWPG